MPGLPEFEVADFKQNDNNIDFYVQKRNRSDVQYCVLGLSQKNKNSPSSYFYLDAYHSLINLAKTISAIPDTTFQISTTH